MATEKQQDVFFIDKEQIDGIIEMLSSEIVPEGEEERTLFYNERIQIYRMIFSNIISLHMSDSEVLELWHKIETHKREVSRKLGRNIGMRVAVFDYLCNIDKKIETPLIVDNSEYERLINESQNDCKTGVFNSRAFYRMIEKEISRSQRFGLVFSVFLFDLDNFKLFNDSYGHLSGDELLKLIGSIMKKNVRSIDVIARFGGDEFVILFPQTEKITAARICSKLKRKVLAAIEKKFRPDFPVTMSGGIVMYPYNGHDYQSLLLEADKILYQAKSRGKNHIMTYKEKRVQPRYSCNLNIEFLITGKDKIYSGVMRNISEHGALIESKEILELGNFFFKKAQLMEKHGSPGVCSILTWKKTKDDMLQFGCYIKDNPFYEQSFEKESAQQISY